MVDDAVFSAAQSNPILVTPISQNNPIAPSYLPSNSDHNYGMASSDPTPEICDSFSWNAASFRDFITGVETPSSDWNWSFNEKQKNVLCSAHQFLPSGKIMMKTINVLNDRKVELFMNGKSVAPLDLSLEFRSKVELSHIISAFDDKRTCNGIEDETLDTLEITKNSSGFKDGNIWRSKECTGITDKTLFCDNCRTLKNWLQNREKCTPKLEDPRKVAKKLYSMKRALQRMKSKEQVIFNLSQYT